MRVTKAMTSQTIAKISAALGAKSNQHAEIGCDAFAALEVEPDRKEVAEKSAEPRRHRRQRTGIPGGDKHGGGALQHIEQKGGGGKALVAGAQHIGRADIAGADGAHIAEAGGPSEQQSERDRSQQITESQRER